MNTNKNKELVSLQLSIPKNSNKIYNQLFRKGFVMRKNA